MKRLLIVFGLIIIATQPLHARYIMLEELNGKKFVTGTASGAKMTGVDTSIKRENIPDSFTPMNPNDVAEAWYFENGELKYGSTGQTIEPEPKQAFQKINEYFVNTFKVVN